MEGVLAWIGPSVNHLPLLKVVDGPLELCLIEVQWKNCLKVGGLNTKFWNWSEMADINGFASFTLLCMFCN